MVDKARVLEDPIVDMVRVLEDPIVDIVKLLEDPMVENFRGETQLVVYLL